MQDCGDCLQGLTYLINLFEDVDFLDRLRKGWALAMKSHDVKDLIEKTDYTMFTSFLQRMYEDSEQTYAALNYVAGELTRLLQVELRRWQHLFPTDDNTGIDIEKSPILVYFHFCDSIPQIFSEAYADMRMLDVLEIDQWQDYQKLLETNLNLVGTPKEKWGTEEFLRGISILSFLNATEEAIRVWYEARNLNKTDRLVLDFCLGQLTQYLKLCQESSFRPDAERIRRCGVHRLLEQVCSTDPITVFSAIRNTTLDYREDLVRYCRKIVKTAKSS